MIATKLEFRNLWNREGLYEHQEFVRRFISPYTPYKGLLLFHNLGSGKTLTCISICVDHYEFDGRKSIIITRNVHGHHVFQTEIRKYQTMHGLFNQKNIFTMNSYIELNNKLKEMSDEEIIKKYSNTIIVMDEIHNVRGNEIDISVDSVYSQLRRLTSIPVNIKVILSTATPMTDNVRQMEPIMSLLGEDQYISYNDTVRQVADVVYHGETCFENLPPIQIIPMSEKQEENYLNILDSQRQHDVYKTNSQISLFCTRDKLYGNKIRKNIMLKEKKTTKVEPYDLKHKILTYIKYKINISYESELTQYLEECSCKYKFFIDYLKECKGSVFVFIEDVVGSGVEILTEILEISGYHLYLGDDIEKIAKRKRYTFCVGDLEMCPNIEHRIDGFNHPLNKDGEYVKVLIGSKVMSESITLKNVRHFHCITPHWNNTVTSQALGRVVRTGSHNDLAPEDRVIHAFIYCATLSNAESIDVHKLKVSSKKLSEINQVIDKMKLSSIDRLIDHHSEPDTSTYVKHYLYRYEPMLYKELDRILGTGKRHLIQDIQDKMNVHPDITKQLIIRTIVSRRSVNNRFVALWKDEILLHAHPDFALASFNIISSMSYKKSHMPIKHISDDKEIKMYTNITDIRKLTTVQLEAMLEKAIIDNNQEVMDLFKHTLYKCSGYLVHTLSYTKNYKSSYKAVIPIPTAPSGTLRAYNGSEWINLSYKEELFAMKFIREHINLHEDLFLCGILSTIDNEIRICLKITEISVTDARIKHRGRMICTFVKDDLLILASILSSDSTMESLSEKYQHGYRVPLLEDLGVENFLRKYTIQELKKIIEDKIIERNLLFII
jgi:helicase-like protein